MEKNELDKLPFNFRLVFLKFILSAEDLTLTPYSGFTLRGGFGYIFKRISCVAKDKTCDNCILNEKCVYSYIFESPAPGEKRYPYVPHPFIIEPPIGNTLDFNLVLIGKAIEYLPYFIYTFEELGAKGIGKERKKFSLNLVSDCSGKVIYKGEQKVLYKGVQEIIANDIKARRNVNAIQIDFITPTRIKYNGKLTKEITFEIIIRNLLRRISLLALYHCDEKWDIDFSQLIKRAKEIAILDSNLRWHEQERYSTRQKAQMKLGGFVGTAEFKGDLAQFMPYLKLGEYIHIGKATTFGLGKYKIEIKSFI